MKPMTKKIPSCVTSVSARILATAVLVVTLSACGGGGGGGSTNNSGGGTNNGGGTTGQFTISGSIKAPQNAQIDGDLNDVNSPVTLNNSIAEAQPIPNPVVLGGYVNVAGAGPQGRSKTAGDAFDYFSTSLAAGQTITLSMQQTQTAGVMDLDLHLANTSGVIIDSSRSTSGTTESITPAVSGDYLIIVEAFEGASNYSLSIGQSISLNSNRQLRLSSDFVPGEAIVRFTETNDNTGLSKKSTAPSAGITLKNGGAGRAVLVSLDAPTAVKNTFYAKTVSKPSELSFAGTVAENKYKTITKIKQLLSRPDVASVDPNYIRRISSTVPNDKLYPIQWSLPLMNLPQAWDITTGDSSVIIAVVDTGVLLNHPDLQGKTVAGYDFIKSPASALDGDGIDPNPDDPGDHDPGGSSFHGTHVSGIIAATTNNSTGTAGIAWGSKIMPIRTLGKFSGTSYDIMQGVRFAAGLANDSNTLPAQRADIINLSLGGPGFSQSEQDVFNEVRAQGVIVIAAAGNDSSSTPEYPASYSGVVSVSAVDSSRGLAWYSSFGPFIDITAPGGDFSLDLDGDGYMDAVLSSGGSDTSGTIKFTYSFGEGTSMSVPHVAGIVALMKSLYPALTPAGFDSMLANSQLTNDLGASGRDDLFGYGLINAYKAVIAARDASGGTTGPGSPVLAVSPSSINFGSILTSALVTASNAAGGALSLTTAPVGDQSWLSVSPDSVDSSSLGTYTIRVNRSGLTDGVYTGNITFTSDSNIITVPVIMNVASTSFVTDAGLHYISLLKADTQEIVKTVSVPISNGYYAYTFTNVAEGDYQVYAGTDMNNDNFLCDPAEACGAYLTLNQPETLTVNANKSGIDFNTGFAINISSASKNSVKRLPVNTPRRRAIPILRK